MEFLVGFFLNTQIGASLKKNSSPTFEVSCKQGAPKVAKEKLGIRDLNFDGIFLLNKCVKILT